MLYYILEDYTVLCPTHQNDFFDFLWRAPVKHPCRVIPLHVHVHVFDLFISRNKKGVMSTEKRQQYIYVRHFVKWLQPFGWRDNMKEAEDHLGFLRCIHLFIEHIKSTSHSQSVKLFTAPHTVGPITTISFLHSFLSLMSNHQKTERPWCSQWCREQQDLSATDWMAWQHKANYQLLPSLPVPDAMQRK